MPEDLKRAIVIQGFDGAHSTLQLDGSATLAFRYGSQCIMEG